MKFCFFVVIIDEDFCFENILGFGIWVLVEVIEKEGVEVFGFMSYGDLMLFV